MLTAVDTSIVVSGLETIIHASGAGGSSVGLGATDAGPDSNPAINDHFYSANTVIRMFGELLHHLQHQHSDCDGNIPCMTVSIKPPPNTSSPSGASPWWLWGLGAIAGVLVIVAAIELRKKPAEQIRKPPPAVEPSLHTAKPVTQSLDERLLSYLEGHQGEISISRAAYEIGVTESQVKEALSRLTQKGVIRKESP
jgi:hypothetical protein